MQRAAPDLVRYVGQTWSKDLTLQRVSGFAVSVTTGTRQLAPSDHLQENLSVIV